MKPRFPTLLIVAIVGALVIGGLSGHVVAKAELAGAHQVIRPVADLSPVPIAAPTASPVAAVVTPVATPAPAPSPAATPAVLAANTIVAKKVQPTVRAGVSVACQSQTYDPATAALCPRAAPTRQVTLAEISAPAPTPAPTPVATPQPTLAPAAAPTAPPATPTPTPIPAPTPVPACGGGYPAQLCYAAQDTVVDPWGMYNRECVSYTAFRVAASGRHMPYWGGRGNAKQWPANAQAAGIPVSDQPKAGDIAISTAGSWGHAMYVEGLLDGGKIYVSQYNYNGLGTYSTMIVPAAGLSFIHFP